MTSYGESIDRTPAGMGTKFSLVAGTAGVTAGDCVKLDSNGDVVDCDATNDDVIGIARDTVTDGNPVTVLGNGCIVESSSYSLTAGSRTGCSATTGLPKDWASSGTYVGWNLTTTKVLVHIQD